MLVVRTCRKESRYWLLMGHNQPVHDPLVVVQPDPGIAATSHFAAEMCPLEPAETVTVENFRTFAGQTTAGTYLQAELPTYLPRDGTNVGKLKLDFSTPEPTPRGPISHSSAAGHLRTHRTLRLDAKFRTFSAEKRILVAARVPKLRKG